MTSPLRYPGGKTRACKVLHDICVDNFDMNSVSTLVSPFFGGGSFEFSLWKKYGVDIVANDVFTPLYTFWMICKDDNSKSRLVESLRCLIDKVDKSMFKQFRDTIASCEDAHQMSVMYFVLNRCSFSGSTLSGGFSEEASKKRFTPSSIDRVNKLDLSSFEFSNLDFGEFLVNTIANTSGALIFLDPPYYLENGSKLYGNKGDMHSEFEHKRLFVFLNNNPHLDWIMTYNNCGYIRELYKEFTILDVNWAYGMNNTKKSSEIVILHQCT